MILGWPPSCRRAATRNTRKRVMITIINDIPDELWIEILPRLPAKTLLRFKSVCKSWYTLINTHDFQQLHLRIFKNNRDRKYLLSYETNRQIVNLRHSSTFKLIKEIRSEDYVTNSVPMLLGYVDGIFLISPEKIPSLILLWNPSIKFYLEIVVYKLIVGISDRRRLYFGFGLDTVSRNYKVVALYKKSRSSDRLYYKFCDLGNGTWSSEKQSVCAITDLYIDSWSPWMTYFEGRVYWLCYDESASERDTHYSHLLGFNLTDEQFTRLMLPKDKEYELMLSEKWLPRLSVSNEKLMVLSLCNAEHVCVWKKEDDSWVKLYDVDLSYLEYLVLKSYGGLVFRNSKASRIVNLEACGLPGSELWRNVCVYEESLVLLEQFIRYGKYGRWWTYNYNDLMALLGP